MANIASNSISMFPSSMRTGVDVYSRFTTELNLVDIVNRVSSGNFVSKYDSNGNIEFTIGGYNFRTSYTAIAAALGTITPTNNIYAVALTNYSTSTERIEDTILKGWTGSGTSFTLNNSVDDGGNFIGLQIIQGTSTDIANFNSGLDSWIATQTGENITRYTIELLHSKGGGTASVSNWEIPEDQQMTNIDVITTNEIESLFPEIHTP